MERTPAVLKIGENTQGVFCDVLDRHLPNGWAFGLPNAVYRIPDGRAFDVTGIPPDIPVSYFGTKTSPRAAIPPWIRLYGCSRESTTADDRSRETGNP
ncbi:MAG: hypothetical protein IT161_20905 [Bryobacterales bacterium]|nr:hypothetical protein [Bryobacterales bacterium]